MSRPIVIQIIGMHGVGKTSVARMAAHAFARRGLRTAWLDVDLFAQEFCAPRDPKQGALTLREQLVLAATAVKNKVVRMLEFDSEIWSIGMRSEKHLEVRVGQATQSVQAVKTWIREQDADIIFLELHWPMVITRYPYDVLWLVTAPWQRCSQYIVKKYDVKNMSLADMLETLQKPWYRAFGQIPREKQLLSNASLKRNPLRERIARLVDTIVICREDGRYENEEEIPTIPPPPN